MASLHKHKMAARDSMLGSDINLFDWLFHKGMYFSCIQNLPSKQLYARSTCGVSDRTN